MDKEPHPFARPILQESSILRRLPPEVNTIQAFYIDGIRHAVQIIDLAYDRLCETLTSAAVESSEKIDVSELSTHAFLDAWAIVDAMDRFRMLCQQIPGSNKKTPSPEIPPLSESMNSLRLLRNVSDHLAQRIPYVIAHDGCALGILTWFTLVEIDPPIGFLCTLRPGTVRKEPPMDMPPVTITNMEWPTGFISLKAGEHEVNLTELIPHVTARVKAIEESVEESLLKVGLLEAGAASDVLTRKPYQVHPDFLKNLK